MAKCRRYPISQSPLYGLGSKQRLAKVIGIGRQELEALAELADNYNAWTLPQKERDVLAGFPPGKPRNIQQPKPLLADVQSRIAILLGRIERPDFVYSAMKGLSYVHNARAHMNPHRAAKVDIKNFYPSVKQRSVKKFFERDLKCAADVAHLLARLCCADGALPTGSAVSPVLSYFACGPMFHRIREIARQHELEFTLYVDDMVFSGVRADRSLTRAVVAELKRHGFVGHKISHFRPNEAKIITGVAVHADRIDIPFKRQKRIRLFEQAFFGSEEPRKIRILGATLLGQYREGERLQRGSKRRAAPVEQRLSEIDAKHPPEPRLRRAKRRRFGKLKLRAAKLMQRNRPKPP